MDDKKTNDQQEENKASQQDDAPAQKATRAKKQKPQKEKAQGQGNASGGKQMVYKVKGAEPAEETKSPTPQARPQTADASPDDKPKKKRQRKPKAEGGEEVKVEGESPKPRAQTAKPKYRKKGEADEAEAQGETPEGEETKKGDDEPKAPQKNLVYLNPMDFKEKRKFKSKWEEYRHGDWRKGSGKTYVTLDTEIPAMPDPLLKLPDEPAFHKKQVDIEEKIKETTGFLEEKKTQFEEVLDEKKQHLKAGDSGVVPTKELTTKFQKMKALKEQRQKIYNEQDAATEGQGDLITEREFLMKKIDKTYNTEELVPKGIKDQEKKLNTSSSGKNLEQQVIKKIQFLKDSVPHVKKKDKLDALITEQNANKKKAGVGLQPIKKEIQALQKEIDAIKAQQDDKTKHKENYDKQLDDINDKRKKLRDHRDKLYKEKEELRDNYYGGLIQYHKQQYLIQDIKWMTEMKDKIKAREDEKDRRKREYEERQERITRDREERKQRQDDAKKRQQERKEREAENKRIAEEQARQTEVETLARLQGDITSNAIGSNPMFEQITQCEALLKFCQKSRKPAAAEANEEPKEAQGPADAQVNKELDQALKKGAIQLAASKSAKETVLQIGGGAGKGKKGKKTQTAAKEDKFIDFKVIKQFNNLKISAPLSEEDFAQTIEDLKDLKEALIYWGKIIQRQNKIKFIRKCRKISNEEKYTKDAEEEERYIENEKQKFEGDDVAAKTSLKLDKLKIAQVIDRENKQAPAWDQMGDEDEYESDENVFGADDIEEDEDGQAVIRGKRPQRGGRGGAGGDSVVPKGDYYKKPRQAKRGPDAQKFSDIMKNQESFPALDNEDEDEEDASDQEAPTGDVHD